MTRQSADREDRCPSQVAEDRARLVAERIRCSIDLLAFFADRLKVQLREQGARHDLVDAVFALEGQDDLVLIVRRVEALGKFLDTEDGKNLLAGYKRATNIIRIEEKRDEREYVGAPDPQLYRQAEEWALAEAIDTAKAEAAAAVAREDFEAAMRAMARLRPHVDAFFDKVTVNVDEGADKRAARESAQAAQRNPRGHAGGRGFLADRRRLTVACRRARCPELDCIGGDRDELAYHRLRTAGDAMTITVAHITPLVALIAGILILIFPRLLNYVVALYLIIIGLIGLNNIHHFIR